MGERKMEFLNLAGWPWIGATESFLVEAVLAPPPKRQHLCVAHSLAQNLRADQRGSDLR